MYIPKNGVVEGYSEELSRVLRGAQVEKLPVPSILGYTKDCPNP